MEFICNRAGRDGMGFERGVVDCVEGSINMWGDGADLCIAITV